MWKNGSSRRRVLEGVVAGCVGSVAGYRDAVASRIDPRRTKSNTAFDVSIRRTNDPVDPGEVLEVVARVENVGEAAVTREVVLVVGHDPQRVDSATVSLESGETETLVLEFRTATVEHTQTFPVRVESGAAVADRMVEVVGTDDERELDVTFPSCTRAEVTGTFQANDTVAASTGFYDLANGEALFGNTIIEDRLEVGTDVDAPFSGTIVFEVGDEREISETDDGVRVEVPDYGDLGTVLSGITAPEDYAIATITEANPHAPECLDEIERGADGEGPWFGVSIGDANDPVHAGEFLEVNARVENVGAERGSRSVSLIVGHDPQQVDSTDVKLEPGASETVTLGYETYPAARTTEFPVRVEAADDDAERTVEVVGTGEGA